MNSATLYQPNESDEFPATEPRWRAALERLFEARDLAAEPADDIWQFAVEISQLLANGVTVNDLRRWLRRGWVEHAEECMPAGTGPQGFRRLKEYAFGPRTCFVLGDTGADAQADLVGNLIKRGELRAQPDTANGHWAKPHWNSSSGVLSFRGMVVKRLSKRATVQRQLLDFCQRNHWKQFLENGIAAIPEGPRRKKRLHDDLAKLNRNQKSPLLRFHGDGSGTSFWWEAVNP
jgi:hypothetical protein